METDTGGAGVPTVWFCGSGANPIARRRSLGHATGSVQFIQILPYVVTVLVLAGFRGPFAMHEGAGHAVSNASNNA